MTKYLLLAICVLCGVLYWACQTVGELQERLETTQRTLQAEREITFKQLELQNKTDEISHTLKDNISAIWNKAQRFSLEETNSYHVSSAGGSAGSTDLPDGVHTDSATGSVQMPDPAEPASGACRPCTCRCSRPISNHKLVELAAECDVWQIKFNSLRELYLETQRKLAAD